MTLKLLREVQLKTTLAPEERKILETLKAAVGAESIVSLVETAFRPTDADYAKWLDVIRGYANDAGLNINKRSDFMDIAGAVLEAAPEDIPYTMHSPIMSKLWLRFKASRDDAKIEKQARAQEEEERVTQAINCMMEPVEDNEEDYDSYADTEARDMRSSADDPEASGTEAWWHDDSSMTDGDEYADDSITSGGPDMGDDPMGSDDEGDFGQDDRYDERGNVDPNGMYDAGGHYVGGDAMEDRRDHERDRTRDDTAVRSFENEEAGATGTEAAASVPKKMNVLQTMLAMPKKSINQTLKKVEDEGSVAWKQHSLPKNPHPEDSMAYKAWERGMKKAMKTAMGLDEKPAPAPKKKKK
jgi:hypothetical protein